MSGKGGKKTQTKALDRAQTKAKRNSSPPWRRMDVPPRRAAGWCYEKKWTSHCRGKRNSQDTALCLSRKITKASNSNWRSTCKLGIFSPAKSFACSTEGAACDKNIYILKVSALTSVKLESREGGEEVSWVGIINQNILLLLIKSTNLFVTKPL